MAIDEEREFVLTIDSLRSISAVPTSSGSVVVTTIDPQACTFVEISQAELAELITGLSTLKEEM